MAIVGLGTDIAEIDRFEKSLSKLGEAFAKRILTEPKASLSEQYSALMATESVDVSFTEDGISQIADAAWQVNETTENIGARRE